MSRTAVSATQRALPALASTLVGLAFALTANAAPKGLVAMTDTDRTQPGGAVILDPGSTSYRGNYRVPVPAELEAYSGFEAGDVSLEMRERGEVRLSYTLPMELTGRHIRVEARGTKAPGATSFTLKGDRGMKATCSVEGATTGATACRLEYVDLRIDVPARDAFIASRFDASERMSRFEVAARFGNEAIGVLHATLKRRPLSNSY